MRLYTGVKDSIDPEMFKKRAPAAASALALQVERDMRAYIPSKRIIASGVVEGNRIIWRGPLTREFFFGKLYIDPVLHVGGFLTENGWRSRPGVKKVRSARDIRFTVGGPFWTKRATEAHRAAWRKLAKEALQHGEN